ncbi:hypothetical protein CIHG_08400 [Coccidioides immitis H538.4]|uniref:Uncharacterized protein n=3 Tax=Coccidioides immitis TaxID=5501 RepID=A0A0J8QY82_COCIT|nr:hypothetical protein CIRG_06454 [Coccidioides immitis RMSCC 2394]KMU76995.1 hypothetical protein CISG_06230 [Coccidioides immitis RMSCC 3703]KMU90511.1 hypothetical protein CIHG_08400 [Coccidioides immitis H538.4]
MPLQDRANRLLCTLHELMAVGGSSNNPTRFPAGVGCHQQHASPIQLEGFVLCHPFDPMHRKPTWGICETVVIHTVPFFSQKDSGTYPINFPMPYPLCINAFFGADRIIPRILVRPPFQRITSPSALYSDKMLAVMFWPAVGSGSMRIFHWDDFTAMILWRIDPWWESRTLEF